MAISNQASDVRISSQYLEMFNWDVQATACFLLDQTPLSKHNSNELEAHPVPQDLAGNNANMHQNLHNSDESQGLLNEANYDEQLMQEMPRPEFNEEQKKYDRFLNREKNQQGWLSYILSIPFGPIQYAWDTITYNYKTGQQFINVANSLSNNGNLKVDFNNQNFQQFCDTIEHSNKMPAFVYIHKKDGDQILNARIVNELLGNIDLTNILNQNFKCFGIFDNSEELKLVSGLLHEPNYPCFLIFRKDKYEENESLAVISLKTHDEIDIFTISQLLNGAVDTFISKSERERIFINTYKNKKLDLKHFNTMIEQNPEMQQFYPEESIYQNQIPSDNHPL